MLTRALLGSEPWDVWWAWRVWFSPGGIGHTWYLWGHYRKELRTEELSPLAENRLGDEAWAIEIRG